MKLKKILLATSVAASVFTLAACNNEGGQKNAAGFVQYDPASTPKIDDGYTSLLSTNENGAIDEEGYYEVGGKKVKTKDVYKTTYATEISKANLNYLTNSWTYNSQHYTNMVDGLIENDKYGNIVGALAYEYKYENLASGKQTWTLKIRKGVAWSDNATGEVVAEVKAQDFVEGIKYVLQPFNGSATATVVMSALDGAEAYYNSLANEDEGDDLSFEETVGVKAVDDYTIQYTTLEAMPYFLSFLTYSPFLPVNGEYLEEQGTDFGKTENNILVNGAYRMTKHENESEINYTKNANYWDLNHVYLNKIVFTFVPGTATVKTMREWYEAGKIDAFSVRSQDAEGYKKYVTGEDGTGTTTKPASSECNAVMSTGTSTFGGYFNFARTTYDYEGNSANAKTAAEQQAAQKAIQNANFRKGILYGLDMMEYLNLYAADPIQRLARSYTCRELATYNGKDYADYVDEVYNQKQGTTGVSLSGIINGSDPVFDKTKATQFFQAAKTELLAAGLTEADFPIKIDVIGSMDEDSIYVEKLTYDAINTDTTINKIVKINVLTPASEAKSSEWMNVTCNYDLSMLTGWGPDYADPKTFLNTFVVDGDMVDQMGFDGTNKELENQILGGYTALAQKAFAITDDLDARYKAMAEAEYAMIYEYAIFIPWYTGSGYSNTVSKVVPYQAGRASYGLTSDKLKNVVVSENVIDQDTRNAIVAAYDAGKGTK